MYLNFLVDMMLEERSGEVITEPGEIEVEKKKRINKDMHDNKVVDDFQGKMKKQRKESCVTDEQLMSVVYGQL